MSEIILYGAPWCSGCKKAKQYLESKQVTFIYKDVSDEALLEELKALGFQSIPVLLINGETIQGFNQQEYYEKIESFK